MSCDSSTPSFMRRTQVWTRALRPRFGTQAEWQRPREREGEAGQGSTAKGTRPLPTRGGCGRAVRVRGRHGAGTERPLPWAPAPFAQVWRGPRASVRRVGQRVLGGGGGGYRGGYCSGFGGTGIRRTQTEAGRSDRHNAAMSARIYVTFAEKLVP